MAGSVRRVAVTGASGDLGGHVLRLLAGREATDVVALARRPIEVPEGVAVRIADYADREALRRALEDVDTLVFVNSDGEGARVLSHHLNVVAAARECGVGHVVALSSVDADPASPFCYAITSGLTELALRESGCGLSVVRASIYSEFFLGFLRTARDTGRLRLPAGDGRIGLVSRADVARCMAALAVAEPTGRAHDETGPEALDMDAVAAVAAEAWGGATREPWWLYAYTSMLTSVREQRWHRVTDEVRQLTGRPPRSVGEVLRRAR